MSERPLVSVIMPAYNAAATIADSVRSVFEQTMADWELLVVDDGGTDATAEVLATFSDPRVRVFHQENQGQAAARNNAIRRCRGRYVAFLDADDQWLPDKLALQVRAFEESADPRLGMIHTGQLCFRNDDARPFVERVEDPFGVEDPFLRLLVEDRIGMATVMLRREVLDEVGFFDESLHGSEDWDLWIRVAERFSVLKLEQPLALYRMPEDTPERNFSRRHADCWRVIERHALSRPDVPRRIQNMARWNHHRTVTGYRLARGEWRAALASYARMVATRPLARHNLTVPLGKLRRMLGQGLGRFLGRRPSSS